MQFPSNAGCLFLVEADKLILKILKNKIKDFQIRIYLEDLHYDKSDYTDTISIKVWC